MSLPARLVLSLVVAGLLLVALAAWGDVRPSDVLAALRRLPVATYFAALGLHVSIYAVRAVRFACLLPSGQRPPLGTVLACSSAHNLAAYVLPAKTGEASLIVYLKGTGGVPAAAGLASLLVSRLLDLTVLCGGVGAAGAILADRLASPALVRPLSFGLIGVALVMACLCLRPDMLARVAFGVLNALGLARLSIGRKVLDRTAEVSGALRAASARGSLLAGLLLSVAIWALVFAFYAVLARGVGLPHWIGYPEATFGASLATLFNLLPINGFAGFGTQEAGWQIGFELLGVQAELALATGVAVHLIQLTNVVLMGLAGHLAMAALRPTTAAERG